MSFPDIRMRRLRKNQKIRNLVKEVFLTVNDLIYPIFIKENINKPEPIYSMPNQYRFPINKITEEVKDVISLEIPAIILFGIPSTKNNLGTSAYDSNGIIQRSIKKLKSQFGEELVIITDICLCQYTDHGHCGIVEDGQIQNDPTLDLLKKIAISHAKAGADVVAPSCMLDGQVQAIRSALDDIGFIDIIIMSYSAKHSSQFYGPFREAAASSPSFGDRKSYQMDFAKYNEALRETELDIMEGADIVMVKPALAYLDLIYRIKKKFKMPTAAYNVSGEYSMIKAAAEKGWIDEKSIVLEVLTSIKRAGADMIITYFAKEVAEWLKQK